MKVPVEISVSQALGTLSLLHECSFIQQTCSEHLSLRGYCLDANVGRDILHLVLSQRMGLMLAGGTSLSHSLYDTAKTSSADCCGFLLLSHRTEFKQQNDATKPLASEEQPLIKIRG